MMHCAKLILVSIMSMPHFSVLIEKLPFFIFTILLLAYLLKAMSNFILFGNISLYHKVFEHLAVSSDNTNHPRKGGGGGETLLIGRILGYSI